MARFEVHEEPDFEGAVFESDARAAESAAEEFVRCCYDDGWSDNFTVYVRNVETDERFAVDVTARMELVVETDTARRIGRD